jgi:hypothetical protein
LTRVGSGWHLGTNLKVYAANVIHRLPGTP